jgi:hypothetical protein
MQKFFGAFVVAVSLLACQTLCPAESGGSMVSGASATPEWGPAANGLRCSITLGESKLRVGDTLVVGVTFENVSDKSLTLYYDPEGVDGRHLSILVAGGRPAEVQEELFGGSHILRSPFHLLAPRQTHTAAISGRLLLDQNRPPYLPSAPPTRDILLHCGGASYRLVSPGEYRICFRYSSDQRTVAYGERYGAKSVWTGSLQSNLVSFSVRYSSREELDLAIETFQGGTPTQQVQAAEFIRANADQHAVPALMTALASADYLRLGPVVAALRVTGDPSLVPQLLDIYRTADSDERRQDVLEVLRATALNTGEVLTEVIRSDVGSKLRVYAAEGLSYGTANREAYAVNALLDTIKASDPQLRCTAAEGLGVLIDGELRRRAVSRLIEVMDSDPDATVRSKAAGSLGFIRDSEAVPALLRALRDREPSVGAAAAGALGRVGGSDAIGALREFAKVSRDQFQVYAATNAIRAIQARERGQN